MLALMTRAFVPGTSITLTTDPPSDVDVEEREYGDDSAKDGRDDIFHRQNPSWGRR